MMQVIQGTGAQQIWVTHGYIPEVVRWLREQGLDAVGLSTRFSDQADETLEEGGEA
jgi:putative mRNA 3-end processing factor